MKSLCKHQVQADIVLASSSPRRAEILSLAGYSFTIHPVQTQEEFIRGSAKNNARRIAYQKAYSAYLSRPGSVIIAADTFIIYRGCFLGKPENRVRAYNMLSLLSGRTHRVITGFCVYDPVSGIFHKGTDITRVSFRHLSEKDIEWYLSTSEWENAAGAYKIQGAGSCLITKISGSFHNVMGLPIHRIYGILCRL